MDKIKVGNKWVCLKERKKKEKKIGERDNNVSEIVEDERVKSVLLAGKRFGKVRVRVKVMEERKMNQMRERNLGI